MGQLIEETCTGQCMMDLRQKSLPSLSSITCSKLTIETLEQGVKLNNKDTRTTPMVLQIHVINNTATPLCIDYLSWSIIFNIRTI